MIREVKYELLFIIKTGVSTRYETIFSEKFSYLCLKYRFKPLKQEDF